MNELCREYAAKINEMRAPGNYARVEVLNRERAVLHDRLAAAFHLSKEETKQVTDNLPELSDYDLAVYLDNALSSQVNLHDINVQKNWESYELYLYLYHETWYLPGEVDNLKTLGVIDHRAWNLGSEQLKAFFAWIESNKTACALDKAADGVDPWYRYKELCTALFAVHPSLVVRHIAGVLFEFLQKDDSHARIVSGKIDHWLNDMAKKLCVPVAELKKLMLSSASLSFSEFNGRLNSLVEKQLEV